MGAGSLSGALCIWDPSRGSGSLLRGKCSGAEEAFEQGDMLVLQAQVVSTGMLSSPGMQVPYLSLKPWPVWRKQV